MPTGAPGRTPRTAPDRANRAVAAARGGGRWAVGGETRILAAARAYRRATDWNTRIPPDFAE